MTVRYSGDAEIRIGLEKDERGLFYRGSVIDAERRFHGWVPIAASGRDPASSEAYDDAARRLAKVADTWWQRRGKRFALERDGRGRVRIRRGFQSPCPLEDL